MHKGGNSAGITFHEYIILNFWNEKSEKWKIRRIKLVQKNSSHYAFIYLWIYNRQAQNFLP